MTDITKRSEMHSVASAFAALTRVAKPGQTICFRSSPSGNSPERSGVLRELLPEGMVIDTDSGTEWIPALDIHAWRVPKQPLPPAGMSQQTSPLPSVASLERKPTMTAEVTQLSSEASAGHLPSPVIAALPALADLELLFAGDPVMVLPAPSFDSQGLDKSVQQDINRWRNRYEYALKVREPARMSQDVASIAELAESLTQPALYFLAGLLADFSGLGTARSKTCFQSALELDPNYQEATTAIAALSMRDKDWANAAKFLLWAVRLDGNSDKTSLVRWLGQCVQRLNGVGIPSIGLLLSCVLPETARRLALSLIALVVQENLDAYRAALLGDAEQLRQTRIGNDLFPWKDEIVAPIEPRITRPTPTATTSARDATRRGRVSAYYPNRNFGFIVENSTGQTWFFHKTSIISPSLLRSVIDGNVRQDVILRAIRKKDGK